MKVSFRKLLILNIILLWCCFLTAQDTLLTDADQLDSAFYEEQLSEDSFDIEEEFDYEEESWTDCFLELELARSGGIDLAAATKKYRDDPTYNYEKDPEKESGLFSKLWYKFLRWLRNSTGISIPNGTGTVLKYLIIGLGAFLILKFLLQAELGSFLRKKEVLLEDLESEFVDADMSESDLSSLIEKAESQSAFRLAIRFRYLRTLRKLDDSNLILWKPGKTNTSYINEIKEERLRSSFEQITKVYEYIWYGEHHIDNVSEYRNQLSVFHKIEEQL